MSRQPLANASANQINGVVLSSNPTTNFPAPPYSPPRGIDVIVSFAIAVILDDQSIIQTLSRLDQRLPVPLDHVRSFAGMRRCIRLLLQQTLAQYGVTPAQMTHCAAMVPPARHPEMGGYLRATNSEFIWQGHINTIGSMYHAICTRPLTCAICRDRAFVVACFPERIWTRIPLDTGIVLRDIYNEEHARTLGELGWLEQVRYATIMRRRVHLLQAPPAADQSQNSSSTGSPQPRNTNRTDPTRGPKGRRLIGTPRSPSNKVPDYSKATLFPATATQGVKAESDTCLTCIKYHRSCKGTTMTFVKSSRTDKPSQWKCECCQNPQRRCLWRPRMNAVTSYEEVFKAQGGTNIAANTVQGRRDRAIRRGAYTTSVQNDDNNVEGRSESNEEDYDGDLDGYSAGGANSGNTEESEDYVKKEEEDDDVHIKQEAD